MSLSVIIEPKSEIMYNYFYDFINNEFVVLLVIPCNVAFSLKVQDKNINLVFNELFSTLFCLYTTKVIDSKPISFDKMTQ